MRLRVIIRGEAEIDIRDSAAWYERQQQALGHAFVNEVESAIERACLNPFHYPCLRRSPEVRRVLTRRFPHRVFFIRRHDAIVVFRVLHGARNDCEWQSKLPRK